MVAQDTTPAAPMAPMAPPDPAARYMPSLGHLDVRATGSTTMFFNYVGVGLNADYALLPLKMTFEAGGRQYVAILTGLGRNAKAALVNTPELREMRSQTMLFVFGL